MVPRPPGPQEDSRELQFLGRTIRLTPEGIELEGDDKHVTLMEQEWDMTCCNRVSTPYVKPRVFVNEALGGARVEPKDMCSGDATLNRRAAARINYIALDRPDLSFASRVASSQMSSPKEGDDLLIKRSGYSVSVPRRV